MEQRTKTTVAYRCPACGAILTIDVTKERLEKGKMNMPCIQCGKSHLDIVKEPSGSISLLVPCLMCPHPHPYKISPEMFFEKEIFCFPCSFTGIDICFIGDADYVDDEIIRSGREISSESIRAISSFLQTFRPSFRARPRPTLVGSCTCTMMPG